jgi:hypothetical protein
MSDRIRNDSDEVWRGAGKVLALNMLLEQMLSEMKTAQIQYRHAFGDGDPQDQASQQGKQNYIPREEGGLAFCANAIIMVGSDGDAVKTAATILQGSGEIATETAGGGRHG